MTQRERQILELIARNPMISQAELADKLGIPRQATIAMGDSTNDLSMIRAAGLGLAMENANEAVKAEADAIKAAEREAAAAQKAAEKAAADAEKARLKEIEKAEKEAQKEKEKKEKARQQSIKNVAKSGGSTVGREIGQTVGKAIAGDFGKKLGGNLGASLGRGIMDTLFKK